MLSQKYFTTAIPGSLLFLLFLGGCQNNLLDRVGWNTQLAVPLAEGRLDIYDLVPDSNLSVQSDNHVWLVYKNPIYQLNLAKDYIEIPDTSLRQKVSLDSLRLPDRTVQYPITLGQIARADNSVVGTIILQSHGQQAAIPPFDNLSADALPVDATELFKSADMEEGYMDLEIYNGLPVPITDLQFTLRNASDNSKVVSDQIAEILPGKTNTKTYDLSGQVLEGELVADIENINSPGSNGKEVAIDTSDALELNITVRDLKLNAAEAVFPAQNLVNLKKEVEYNMNGPEFTNMKIRSGNLVITAFNTIEDSLFLNYQIPYAVSEAGDPINEFTSVAPAQGSNATQVDKTVDLSGYTIDLTGTDNRKFNTFYNELTGRIDSTGKLIYISLEDSISVNYALLDIVPEYVEGYVGKEQISVGPAQQELSVFKGFGGGNLDFENVNLSFSVYNALGVDASVKMEYLRAITADQQQIDLQAPFIGNQLAINRAFQNPFEPGITHIKLTEGNSNIKEIINRQPQQLEYALDLNVNPDGNRLNYQDFVNFDAPFEVSLDMEVPLSMIADDLVLKSEAALNLKEPEDQDPGKLESATIIMEVANSFPMSVASQVYLMNDGNITDSLFTEKATISAAEMNESTCMTNTPAKQTLEVEVRGEKLDKLRQADGYQFHSLLNTGEQPQGCSDHVKIYSDYYLDFKIGNKLNYKVGK